MSSDPLSDILHLAEVESVVSGSLVAGGTWAFRFTAHEKTKFYVVSKGGCWLRFRDRRKPLRLEEGDVLLLSGSSGFVLASSINAPPSEVCPVFEASGGDARVGTKTECVLLVGVVSLNPSSAARFMTALPSQVHVHASGAGAAPLRWIIERIDHERRAGQLGAGLASAQLAQLLFLEVLRAEFEGTKVLPAGWLRAVRDDRLVRALRQVHEEPGRAWTLRELAQSAAMSRARFAARFKAAAGVAPLAYVTEWRMQLAQRMLRDETASVADISASLGYGSESAFSHAFKRVTGLGPRAYRNAEARRRSPATVTEST